MRSARHQRESSCNQGGDPSGDHDLFCSCGMWLRCAMTVVVSIRAFERNGLPLEATYPPSTGDELWLKREMTKRRSQRIRIFQKSLRFNMVSQNFTGVYTWLT